MVDNCFKTILEMCTTEKRDITDIDGFFKISKLKYNI